MIESVVLSMVVAFTPPAAPQQEPSRPAEERAASAPPTRSELRPPLRIAVTDIDASGVPDSWRPVIQASLVAEVRKLAHTSVIGTDEVRAILDVEAQKQLAGCSDDSCLSELAEALGVDVVVTASIARVGDEHVFTAKRLDQRHAQVAGGVARRFAAGNGEEFLVALGPAVADLFPDIPLRPGAKRGVAKEFAARLNPPPLKPWTIVIGAGSTGVVAVGAGSLFAANLAALDDHARYVATAAPYDKSVDDEKATLVSGLATAAWTAAVLSVALGTATTVAVFFTDFSEAD